MAVAQAAKLGWSPLRGLLRLSKAARDIDDRAQAVVWISGEQEDMPPNLGLLLGGSSQGCKTLAPLWVAVRRGRC